MKTIVLGLGNTLLGDDGAGIHALKQLADTWSVDQSDVSFVDGGTLSFTLTDVIEGADNLIVIDAAQLNAVPGTVMVFENEAMDDFVTNGKCSSVHEVSLAELLDIARLIDCLPTRRALIGIQPQNIDWAEHPSKLVAQAIPHACQQAKTLLEAWI